MPSKKSYNRFFIILQEEQKGYGIDSNKTPSGYAKLEIRNDRAKTYFYIQDIKKQNGPYHMVLIAQNDDGGKELINLGQLTISDNGKADISSEHDANNVLNTSISMDKVQGAGICRVNGTKVTPIMVGFVCGEELKNWSTYPMAKSVSKSTKNVETETIKNKEKDIKDSLSETKNIKQEKKVEEKKHDNKNEKMDKVECTKDKKDGRDESVDQNKTVLKSDVDELGKCAQNFDEYEEQIEKLKADREKHKTKECDEKCENYHEHHHEEHHEEHHSKDKYEKVADLKAKGEHLVGPMGDFFMDIVKDLDKIGYKDQVKNCSWYKVKVENLDSMYSMSDYNKYSVLFYPMICYYPYISKHKHFMVGYKCDDEGVLKYIIYAIPGTKDIVNQPYEGKTGFVTFMDKDDKCDNGYWLMYYDVKNNSVVIPVKRNR